MKFFFWKIHTKDTKEEKNTKRNKGGFCTLSYREAVNLSLLTATPSFLSSLCDLCTFVSFV